MHIPGMMFQDQSWNSFQKLLGDIALDYYEWHGCDELIDWPNWQQHWPKFRDQLLLGIDQRAKEFNRIIERSPMHDDAKSAEVTGQDLACELVLAWGQLREKPDPEDESGSASCPVLMRALGSKLKKVQSKLRKQPAASALDEDDDADEIDAFLESQAKAEPSVSPTAHGDAPPNPQRALWRQATNWVLKDLRDAVDVDNYNKAHASDIHQARDAMSRHQLKRLRWVDTYLRDIDRFIALDTLVEDWLPAIVGPDRMAQRAATGHLPSVRLTPVAEAAQWLLAYDSHHDALRTVLLQRLSQPQQAGMLLLTVKTPLHRMGSKFTCTVDSVSKLIRTLRSAENAAIGNNITLGKRFGTAVDEDGNAPDLPEGTIDPIDCDTRLLERVMQVAPEALIATAGTATVPEPDAPRTGPISGNRSRKRRTSAATQAQSAAALAQKAEEMMLMHLSTHYPQMMQAALLKHFGQGRCDARTVAVLEHMGVWQALGIEPDLSALDFELLGRHTPGSEGKPMTAEEFRQAFKQAKDQFYSFVSDSADTLMAIEP